MEKNEDSECPVCLEELNNANKIVTPCGHEFCKICIYKWLDKAEGGKRKCPICNYEISTEYLKSISKSNTKAETAHSRRSDKSSQTKSEVVPLPLIQRRLPLIMYGSANNDITLRNGRLFINDIECQDGNYEQDGHKITIENGIFTSIDKKGKKTCFGGNISGHFSWNRKTNVLF